MQAESESDDDDQQIYNPLKLPMGWDGKPIPYWLYKLHGLGQVCPGKLRIYDVVVHIEYELTASYAASNLSIWDQMKMKSIS